MKEIAKALKLGTSGSKRILFNRIRDSVDSRITKIDVDTFDYKTKKQAAQSVPKWIVLSAEPVPAMDNIADSGAEHGFYAPTNRIM